MQASKCVQSANSGYRYARSAQRRSVRTEPVVDWDTIAFWFYYLRD
jgi:hypothetical protein